MELLPFAIRYIGRADEDESCKYGPLREELLPFAKFAIISFSTIYGVTSFYHIWAGL
jgi:hypothetical protein